MASQPAGHNPVASKDVGGSADLTGLEGYCVKLTSDEIVLASAVGDGPVWVLSHGAPVGKVAGIGNGKSKVLLGEAVTSIGQPLGPKSDGKWQLANTTGDTIGAIAEEIGASGTFISATVLVDTGHLVL